MEDIYKYKIAYIYFCNILLYKLAIMCIFCNMFQYITLIYNILFNICTYNFIYLQYIIY